MSNGIEYVGVITGLRYTDSDIRKNQMPECVMKVASNTSKERIDELIKAERIERQCSDCKACASYNYI